MKRKAIKIFSVILALCVIASVSVLSTSAISYKTDVKTKSESILLVNMDSGQAVYEKDPDSKRYPASTTKIMTYIVAVENIDDLDNTRIPIKQEILDLLLGTGSSMADLEDHVGKTMSAIDLLYAMMVPSGNDAAMVLADYVGGGDIDKFVQMMNDKAKELKCENTHFANPDGLHDKNHYTTARDLYKITTYALTLPRFADITNTTTYTCEGDEYPLVTTNLLIDEYRGGDYYYTYAKGIKTGYTDEAGRCLVTTATADGYSYMAVILKAPYMNGDEEEYYSMLDAADLFRWALTSLELQTVKSSTTPVCEQKIKLAWGKESVNLVPKQNLNAIVPKDIKPENIVVETDIPEIYEAPISTDTTIGTATVYYVDSQSGEKQKIATVDLVSEENIDRSGILYVLDVIGTIFQSYWFIILIAIIVFILIIYFIVSAIIRKRRKRNRRVKRYRNF